ncbi:MAG: heavy-metal-associated domain-containing protein [Bacteroidetes bacterium]|nr:heavy-metal-associated domain-containing protein [Bacteroidota bacterium]
MMKTAEINIENLKCYGCANTIKREVKRFPEVTDVSVNFEEPNVVIHYESDDDLREAFVRKLARFGYPEKGNKNFSNTMLSYMSCAIGRIQKDV